MKILVVGGGGREHALCWAIARSRHCGALYCAPGNAGINSIATRVAIAADDIDGLVAFATAQRLDLVVVGPEVPLVLGLVDRLAERGIRAFGPSKAAAALEGSKGFMKDMAARCGIPTAAYARFTDADAARTYIRAHGAPIVVKTDGLAAGKGVVVAMTEQQALAAVETMMEQRAFGAAGDELIVEDFLGGEEASFFAIVDGATALPLAAAQDHKRVGDGDQGPNTGGMGAYSPAPVVTPAVETKIMQRCIMPLVAGMSAAGTPYKGVLFAGVMIADGEPTLLEYNVRFGDPECQVLLARLQSDIVELLLAACDGGLARHHLVWRDEPALAVVMAARGYPGPFRRGAVIDGLTQAQAVDGVMVFHAGTALNTEGKVVSDGGRVLTVTATGPSVALARLRAYQAVDRIIWDDGFCRRDIGWRALNELVGTSETDH